MRSGTIESWFAKEVFPLVTITWSLICVLWLNCVPRVVPWFLTQRIRCSCPGQGRGFPGGQSKFAPALARAAVATGVAAVFMETHPHPEKALSDGPNVIPMATIGRVLEDLRAIDEVVKPQIACRETWSFNPLSNGAAT